MDLAGIAAIAGVPLAVVAAMLAFARERAPLRRLERIAPLVADLDEGTAAQKALKLTRDELVIQVAMAATAPKFAFWSFMVAWLALSTVGFAAITSLWFANPDPDDPGKVIESLVVTFATGGMTATAMGFRTGQLRNWRKARREELAR